MCWQAQSVCVIAALKGKSNQQPSVAISKDLLPVSELQFLLEASFLLWGWKLEGALLGAAPHAGPGCS